MSELNSPSILCAAHDSPSPVLADTKVLESRSARNLSVKGRLKPGVSMAQAQAELTTLARNLQRTYPDTNKNQDMVVRTELQTRIDQDPIDAVHIGYAAHVIRRHAVGSLHQCSESVDQQPAPARAKEDGSLRLAIGAGQNSLSSPIDPLRVCWLHSRANCSV